MRYLSAFIVLLLFVSISHAGYKELFEKEFMLSPWAGVQFEDSTCIVCHTSDKFGPEMKDITEKWRQSWHAKNDVSCHNCHGGDPEDQSKAMSHERGFLGIPKASDVPDNCGKCHIGILQIYKESGHGRRFTSTAEGPSCTTCHGSHGVQQASIEIINEELCSQCHSYDRAKSMRQALFVVEKRMAETKKRLDDLKSKGAMIDGQERSYFRTHSEFRTLFHTIEVDLVTERTASFLEKIDTIDHQIDIIYHDLDFRSKFSSFMFLLFTTLGVVLLLLANTYNQKDRK